MAYKDKVYTIILIFKTKMHGIQNPFYMLLQKRNQTNAYKMLIHYC